MHDIALIEQYKPLIHKYVSVFADFYEREDLLQEIYLAFISAMRAFDSKKGQFGRFAKRCIINKLIKRKNVIKEQSVGTPNLSMYDSSLFFIDEYIPDYVSKTQRELLELYLYGYTYREIGQKHNKSTSWAHQKISNILDIIRKNNNEL